jgi:hypothetical protein
VCYLTDGIRSSAVGLDIDLQAVRLQVLSRWGGCSFIFTYLFRLLCGIYSASNRSQYMGYSLVSKGDRCVGLTNLPPSCADCRKLLTTSNSWSPRGLLGLYRDRFTFTITSLVVLCFSSTELLRFVWVILTRTCSVLLFPKQVTYELRTILWRWNNAWLLLLYHAFGLCWFLSLFLLYFVYLYQYELVSIRLSEITEFLDVSRRVWGSVMVKALRY